MRPGTWAEADAHYAAGPPTTGEGRYARQVQSLQIKQRELPSHAGVRQLIPDICVFLHQELLHGAAATSSLWKKTDEGPITGS